MTTDFDDLWLTPSFTLQFGSSFLRVGDIAHFIAEKQLADGAFLQVREWTSDCVQPGRQMFQLRLRHPQGREANFPSAYERYTKKDVQQWYEQIKTAEDFMKVFCEVEK